MMKKFICLFCVLAALLAISGCQNQSSDTLKWCLPECGLNDEIIEALNKELHDDGCKYKIELVQIELSAEKLYSEQVLEYEKNNGSLDVVSSGYAFSKTADAGYDFIKNGYFMPLDNLSDYSAVPEKLWETVKVNDTVYTVPGLNFKDSGLTFYFNKAYISEQQIADFNGDVSQLGNMLAGLEVNEEEKFVPLFYNINYIDYAGYCPCTIKGGLILDNASGLAVNPYEFEPFVEYSRKLNGLYKQGFFGNAINFSEHKPTIELAPIDFAVMVSAVKCDENYFKENGYENMELASYTLPFYLENRVLYSMGIAANSAKKEQAQDFLKRIYSDTKYAKILLDGTGAERLTIGIPTTDIKDNYNNAETSVFAGVDLFAGDIDAELCDMLILSFDKLCKSNSFDETLLEIKDKLEKAGIEDYVKSVNKLLEKKNAPANQ